MFIRTLVSALLPAAAAAAAAPPGPHPTNPFSHLSKPTLKIPTFRVRGKINFIALQDILSDADSKVDDWRGTRVSAGAFYTFFP